MVNDFCVKSTECDSGIKESNDFVENVTSQSTFIEKLNRELSEIDVSSDKGVESNKYYLPAYVEYFRNLFVTNLPLWTRQESSDKQSTKSRWKYSRKDNSRNREYECTQNIFTFAKQDLSSPAIVIEKFISKHFDDVQGLRRQYIDSVRGSSSGKRRRSRGKMKGNLQRYASYHCVMTEY